MTTNIHQKFIETPISNILKEAVTACKTIGDGIETHPLAEYVFQTAFLQMTGASEQKLKCICWEMATYDYEFRSDFLNKPKDKLHLQSTLSKYDSKKHLFEKVQSCIKNIIPHWQATEIINKKQELLNKCKKTLENILSTSPLIKWYPKFYLDYQKEIATYQSTDFANPINNNTGLSFLESTLLELYDTHTYKHRNRCAHNARSYQQHLPTLTSLADRKYIGDNYFLMYFVLILMDELFMVLYQEYLKALESTAL